MRLSTCLAFMPAAMVFGSPLFSLDKRAVSADVYNDLVHYFKYAASSYASSCAHPNGHTLVQAIDNAATDTQGFIARDDEKKEIVVVFRGTTSIQDWIINGDLALVAFNSAGVSSPGGTLVHQGYQIAWNSVAPTIISTVKSQLSSHPGYSVVAVGHSMGGALSSLAGISLKQNFPTTALRMYSYGQPRTGNKAYATFVNNVVGVDNLFRSVHTDDGVPTIIPTSSGYYHHATEYWQDPDPSSASNVRKCDASGEDPTCSASRPSRGFDAHNMYYGISSKTPYCT